MKILEVQHLTKDFGGLRAVDSLDLDIEEGEILGLIGPNGAGKSTVFNCVAGVFPPTKGHIYFRSEEISGRKPWDLCKYGLARTFQIVKPFASKSVLYNVMVGAFAITGKTSEARERALEVLEYLNFEDRKDTRAGNLTIADRKRLEIARALATDPKLLLPACGRLKWTIWCPLSVGCANRASPSLSSNTSCAPSWPFPTGSSSFNSVRRSPRVCRNRSRPTRT
jgi:branched-chain amino acid transport system ATP-binding protein